MGPTTNPIEHCDVTMLHLVASRLNKHIVDWKEEGQKTSILIFLSQCTII